jgi:hypothetical protein
MAPSHASARADIAARTATGFAVHRAHRRRGIDIFRVGGRADRRSVGHSAFGHSASDINIHSVARWTPMFDVLRSNPRRVACVVNPRAIRVDRDVVVLWTHSVQ